MPRISEFYGLTISMYFNDHAPPHFHVVYSGSQGVVEIATGALLAGDLPARAARLAAEWAALHRDELMDNWNRARAKQALAAIAPLE